MWPVVISMTLYTFLCGLAVHHGPRAAFSALLLNFWYAIACPLVGSSVGENVIGFLVGGLLAMIVVAIYTLINGYIRGKGVHDADQSETGVSEKCLPSPFLKSPEFQFAAVKAIATGFAVLIGWSLVDVNPF